MLANHDRCCRTCQHSFRADEQMWVCRHSPPQANLLVERGQLQVRSDFPRILPDTMVCGQHSPDLSIQRSN